MFFAIIEDVIYTTETLEDMEILKSVMAELGLSEIALVSGDPEGDFVQTGFKIFAESWKKIIDTPRG